MQIIGLAGPARVGKNAVSDCLTGTYGFVRYAFADPLYEEVNKAFGISPKMADTLKNTGAKEEPMWSLAIQHSDDLRFIDFMDDLGHLSRTPRSYRWILQQWGTEYRRTQDSEYWIKKADQFLAAYIGTNTVTVTQEMYDQQEQLRLESGMFDEDAKPNFNVGDQIVHDHPGLVVEGVRFENEVDWIRGLNGRLWHIERDVDVLEATTRAHVSANKIEPRTGDKIIYNYGTLNELCTGVGLALRGNDVVNTRPA